MESLMLMRERLLSLQWVERISLLLFLSYCYSDDDDGDHRWLKFTALLLLVSCYDYELTPFFTKKSINDIVHSC